VSDLFLFFLFPEAEVAAVVVEVVKALLVVVEVAVVVHVEVVAVVVEVVAAVLSYASSARLCNSHFLADRVRCVLR
jgi:hypothetical protein